MAKRTRKPVYCKSIEDCPHKKNAQCSQLSHCMYQSIKAETA